MRISLKQATLTLLGLVLSIAAMAAPKVSFTTSAPLIVESSENFRVEFSLNASPDDKSFVPPSFEGLDVLYGPATSTGMSVQVINGTTTRTQSYTITYVVAAQKAGNITIGAAEVGVDGKTYRTKPQPIEVVEAGGNTQGSIQNGGNQSQSGGNQGNNLNQGSTQSTEKEILLTASVSRQNLYKGEPVRVIFKLYTRLPIVGSEDYKFPSFNGFWSQEIKQTDQTVQRATLGGRVYNSSVVGDYILYPQQAGKLTIEPMSITAIAQIVTQSNRNMDPFFGGGPEIHQVKRKLQSQRITLDVKELPAGAPASFGGAVGEYELSSTPPASSFTANSAATYTIKISGRGNLTFVQAPDLKLPTSFEQYTVKTTESISTTAAGAVGYRQFEYPFIARAEGDFTIPQVEFTYFDPKQGSYVTLSTKEQQVNILADGSATSTSHSTLGGSTLSKEEVKLLGEDIRFIRLGNAKLSLKEQPFYGSGLYWGLMALIAAAAIGSYSFLRSQIKLSSNSVMLRGVRANKVAVQRFKVAKKYLTENNQTQFYQETLRAMWGYISDKFNIPVADLTKESVRDQLQRRGLSQQQSAHFTDIISKCDEAQYSPQTSSQMSDVYSEAIEMISLVETTSKR